MFIVFFGPILLIYSLIDYFAYRQWSLLYLALRDESYFALTEKLKQAGIKYRTKNIVNQTVSPMFGDNRYRQYEIYVKKSDVEKASQIVSTLRKL
ncbi:hypothetical protein V7087_02935 [Neobacillus niacini]|uniref:hypothetical protein n=1 Tax=Neobacillus niacini TaxID=86668 RepID=UPI00300098AC